MITELPIEICGAHVFNIHSAPQTLCRLVLILYQASYIFF
jgi:hypothetical protein